MGMDMGGEYSTAGNGAMDSNTLLNGSISIGICEVQQRYRTHMTQQPPSES
jgi:hypothetical protein